MLARVRIALLIGATAPAVSACGAGRPQVEQPPTATSDGYWIGEPYPIRLFTHCDVRWAEFAGRSWKADPPRPELVTVPDNTTGMGSYDGYTQGRMTLLALDRARFDVTAPRSLPGGVEFTPTDEPTPPCQ